MAKNLIKVKATRRLTNPKTKSLTKVTGQVSTFVLVRVPPMQTYKAEDICTYVEEAVNRHASFTKPKMDEMMYTQDDIIVKLLPNSVAVVILDSMVKQTVDQ